MTSSTNDTTPPIVFRGVDMTFGTRAVFRELSCDFPRGKITAILGGSGSGKSTVLRLIGGLVRPVAGTITVDGEDITRLSETEMYRVRQQIGMMFQGGALLDSLTVFDNLAFPLRERSDLAESEIARQVHARLAAVGLTDVDDLLPGQLSGGMVKRIALARAIMMNPVILLCDEPLSGLDPISARRIESMLVAINRAQGMTIVVVSHSIGATMRMADHLLLLLPEGAVSGTRTELAGRREARVAAFLSDDVDESLLAELEVEGGVRPGAAAGPARSSARR